MFCKFCNKEITDDSTFCSYCGARVEHTEEMPQQGVSLGGQEPDFPKQENTANGQTEETSQNGISSNKKITKTDKIVLASVAAVVILCLVVLICCLVDCDNDYDSGSDYGGGYYDDDYSSGTVSEYLGLSLSVTSIKTSDNYTYVYCKIENVSARYGNATMYRYVKVKALFKDRYGDIVDTDWTYAVDSAWLQSGESKTFYYMVRDTSVKSATLSIIS